MEICVIHIVNHRPITVAGHEIGREIDGPQRQVNNTTLMLWTAGVYINEHWTHLCCLETILKTKIHQWV